MGRGEWTLMLWVGAGGFIGSSLRFLLSGWVQRLVIEIVETREKIEKFLPTIDGAIQEGLATLEKVEIRFCCHSGQAKPS